MITFTRIGLDEPELTTEARVERARLYIYTPDCGVMNAELAEVFSK